MARHIMDGDDIAPSPADLARQTLYPVFHSVTANLYDAIAYLANPITHATDFVGFYK